VPETADELRECEEFFNFILLQNGWVTLPGGQHVYDPDAAHEELCQ